jgi:hypothetical protein
VCACRYLGASAVRRAVIEKILVDPAHRESSGN